MKTLNSKENSKGITLIALVITIIILLILAGISISALTSDNGLFGRAKEAKEKSEIGQAQEEISNILNEWAIEKTSGTQTMKEFLDSKVTSGEINSVTDNGDGTYEIVTNGGYSVIVNEDGKIIGELQNAGPRIEIGEIKITTDGVTLAEDNKVPQGTPLQIDFTHSINGGTTTVNKELPYTTDGTETEVVFVITGIVGSKKYTKNVNVSIEKKYKQPTIADSVNIGDFIDYDAGTWTQQEIESLGELYSGTALPTTRFKFGGFGVGSNKNTSIRPYGTSESNKYSKGWRVLSKNDDGTLNIIQAGTTEGYYHPAFSMNAGHISEYILSGGKRETDYNTYLARDFSMYEDKLTNHYAIEGSAHCINYSEITKIEVDNDLRKTNAYYYLANLYNDYSLYCILHTGNIETYGQEYCFGIRPVLTLKSNLEIIGGDGSFDVPYTIKLK